MSTTPLKMEFLRRRVSRLKGMFLWLYTVYINPRRLEALPNQDSQKARFPLSSFALSYLSSFRYLFSGLLTTFITSLAPLFRFLMKLLMWLLRKVVLRLLVLWACLFLMRILLAPLLTGVLTLF
ncbi:Uncharacterised protein [Aeromonas caviae]|nr:Uncharacterised protein [Aeromonas caviae]SQH59621.1 Uncharacterised protein [Aeromonas caviae]SQH59632.1 Uncharacterised protein [Aeromonas caviae]